MPLKKEDLIDSMLLKGKTYTEIATELKIGYNTISKRVKFLGPNLNIPKKSSRKNNDTTTTKKTIYKPYVSREEINFIKGLIIRATHRRIISQNESITALEILFNI